MSYNKWPNIKFTTKESRSLWRQIYDYNNYPSFDLNNMRRYWRASSLVVPHRVVDIGCGEGVLGKILGEAINIGCPQIEYCGVDFAQGYNNWDLNKKFPAKSNWFDTGFALDVLEHLKDPEYTIKELARIVEYRIVVTVPQCNKNPDANHLWNFTYDDLVKLVGFCGKIGGIEEISGIGWIAWADKLLWEDQAISKSIYH